MGQGSERPVITTIVPTYRRPNLLRRAILSVLNQTYPHFHVWVYDNASGDETASVVSQLATIDPRIKYHCHSTNIGAAKNFAYAIDRVATPLFSFLSDDDLLLPNLYKVAVETLEAYPSAGFFAGATIHENERGMALTVSLRDWEEGLYEPPRGLLAMLQKGHPTWTGIVFRRACAEGFRRVHELTLSDLAFELQIASQRSFYATPTPVAILTLHPAKKSANLSWADLRISIDAITAGLREAWRVDSEIWRAVHCSWSERVSDMVSGYAIERLIAKEAREAAEVLAYCRGDKSCVSKKWWVVDSLVRIANSNRRFRNLTARTLAGMRRVARVTRICQNGRYLEKYGIRPGQSLQEEAATSVRAKK